MADYIITGRIYLTSGIADEELTDISYFSWDRAAKNRLGINMYNNLAGAQAVYKYPQRNYLGSAE